MPPELMRAQPNAPPVRTSRTPVREGTRVGSKMSLATFTPVAPEELPPQQCTLEPVVAHAVSPRALK
jgi:hypothetical protein